MKLTKRIYILFSKPFPKAFLKRVKKMLVYSDIKMDNRVWTGFSFLYSILISIIIVMLFSVFRQVSLLAEAAMFLVFLPIVFFIFYFMFSYVGFQRAKHIEKILPDALQLIAANIRAGLTPDKALFLSARPEFGILSDEIISIGEETIAGKPIDEALSDFARRIDSTKLNRVISLVNEGMRSGGELASLLEKTADDMRMGEILQQEIQANIGAYIVFTMIAILVAAPVLYATSINFVSMITGVREAVGAISIEQAPVVPLNMALLRSPASQQIDIQALRWFSIASLVVSSIFGALLTGVLRYGEEREGVRSIPLFLLVSLAMFFLSVYVLSGFLGSIIAL